MVSGRNDTETSNSSSDNHGNMKQGCEESYFGARKVRTHFERFLFKGFTTVNILA